MIFLLHISKRRFPLVGGMLVLAGCMTMGPPRTTAYRVPNQYSSSYGPVAGGGTSVPSREVIIPETRTERPAVNPVPGFDASRALPEKESTAALPDSTSVPDRLPDRSTESAPVDTEPLRSPTTPAETIPAKPIPPSSTDEMPVLPVLPKADPRPAPVPAKLELLVNVPKRKQVGSPAAYRLLVRNTGSETAEDVDVHCEFDPQLTFNNTSRREVRHRLGRLSPGESKELTLLLLARSAGTYCCRFSVKSRQDRGGSSQPAGAASQPDTSGIEAVWKSVCVEFVSQLVQIEMLGPTLRTVGSRAEFNFKITNRSKKLLPKVHVVLHYDPALAPAVVTQGAIRDKSSLAWDVSDFKVDETAQFQIDFDCKSPDPRVCLQVDVSGAGIPNDQTETCLQILPVQGELDLQISDRDDPIVVGKRAGKTAGPGGRYEVVVTNRGQQAVPEVRLDVNVPPLLKVLSAQVQTGTTPQGTKLLPLKYELTEGRLLFDALPQLAPGEKLVYLLEVEGVAEGVADVRATVRSGLNDNAVSASEPTWVVAE